MSAAELREAAALMRSRAEAATTKAATPWLIARPTPRAVHKFGVVTMTHHGFDGEEVSVAECYSDVEAEHIAGMDPAFALAVADWLDVTANILGQEGHGDWRPAEKAALAVARAYLGTTP